MDVPRLAAGVGVDTLNHRQIKKHETLTGNPEWYEQQREPAPPSPHQEAVENVIDKVLTDLEQQVFYMRYGMQMSIRAIAKELGYPAHRKIQVVLENIKQKVRATIDL